MRRASLLAVLFLLGCTPAAVQRGYVPPDDASTDAPATDDLPATDAPATDAPATDAPATDTPTASDAPPADAPPIACRDDLPCRPAGLVCDRALARCVECVTPGDCGSAQRTCAANRCVPATPCTTSRMCPGQVCDTTRGFCVDCLADVDCMNGTVCRANVCVAPPRMCRSSRECSDLALVCDTTRGHCVECLTDVDCPDGWCSPDALCRPRACTPNEAACLSERSARVCDTRGSAWMERPCASRETCVGGRCAAWTCTPGSASCASLSARRVCNPDGLGATETACAPGEGCRDGACLPRMCTPGSATCASATAQRVCNPDGLGVTDTPCGARSACIAGACTPWRCTPGTTECADGMERVCNDDGQGYTARACAAGSSCRSGQCRPWTCTPGASTCASSTSMSVCDADGGGYRTVACGAMSSCVGGRCSGWTCTPNSRRCAGASAIEACSADGSAWLPPTSCAAPANATAPRCTDGACAFTCNAGYGDCDGGAANGCETALSSSALHCGRCGNACPAGANATATCADGRCGIQCAAGYGDCDGNAANGCETPLASSPAHCGRCGNACPAPTNGAATCTSGACGARCDAGFNRCGDGTCAAEVATETCDQRDNDCDGAVDEGCGTGFCRDPFIAAPEGGVYRGNFNGTGEQRATCGSSYNSQGVDRVWRWTAPRNGTARARLTGDFWPATLYVRSGVCATGTQVACDSQSTQWPTENVSFTVTAGATYFIFIDCHYNGTTYNPRYELTITPP